MYINHSNKNIMDLGDVKPGQVVKFSSRLYIVTGKIENGATACVDLEDGSVMYLYADDTVILYPNASLNLE